MLRKPVTQRRVQIERAQQRIKIAAQILDNNDKIDALREQNEKLRQQKIALVSTSKRRGV